MSMDRISGKKRRWSRNVIEWRPTTEKRNRGRPIARWKDIVESTEGTRWTGIIAYRQGGGHTFRYECEGR